MQYDHREIKYLSIYMSEQFAATINIFILLAKSSSVVITAPPVLGILWKLFRNMEFFEAFGFLSSDLCPAVIASLSEPMIQFRSVLSPALRS